jgi:amidase
MVCREYELAASSTARHSRALALVLALLLGAATPVFAYDPTEKSIAALQADLAAGRTTSVELTKAYLKRIESLNPKLRAVMVLNSEALDAAQAADAARAAGKPLGPLAGVPILIKDNIETADAMPTTAGSLALKDNLNRRDAPVVARLRAAGAIILGKTNLSEWANIRSTRSVSGWSAVGGQTRNPYALDRSPCGSSSGSGSAAAASLAAAAVGTETDGSVTCPSAITGLVGLKPTVGLISRTHIVPISHTQDTAGPMARTVADAAAMLSVMAGADPADPATARAEAHKSDYLAGLTPDSLKGARIGVLRFAAGFNPETEAVFNRALESLKAAGAVLVEVPEPPGLKGVGKLEHAIFMTELKADLNAYLATTARERVPSRTLADLIAFNRAHADVEMSVFGQESFEVAEATRGLDDPDYLKAKADAHRLAGPDGIDAMLAAGRLVALVAPTTGPSWLIDPVLRDRGGGGGAGYLAAIAGYPNLTVPMGQVDGLPVGLSFIGPAWSEARLLGLGYAFEQQTRARKPPLYLDSAQPADPAAWISSGLLPRP